MAQVAVKAKVPEKKDAEGKVTQAAVGPYEIFVECPDTAVDMIKEFGDEPVKSNAIANWKVVIQGGMRSAMKQGLSVEQVQEKFNGAKMGVATVSGAVDAQAAYIAKFKSATPEEQAEMIKNLRAMAAGK